MIKYLEAMEVDKYIRDHRETKPTFVSWAVWIHAPEVGPGNPGIPGRRSWHDLGRA